MKIEPGLKELTKCEMGVYAPVVGNDRLFYVKKKTKRKLRYFTSINY